MNEKMYRVQPGGLFHTHKVKYSPETENFIRELIRESKLSIFQSRKVKESVRNGEPLPLPPTKTARGLNKHNNSPEQKTPKNSIPRRRKKEDIQQSGAYERDLYIPSYAKANHDVEKTKLQEIMAFGRTLKSGKHRTTPQSLKFTNEDDKYENQLIKKTALDHIADEIDERKEFLAKMEAVGRGKEYRGIINQEIEEKLLEADKIMRKLENLNQRKKSHENTQQ